MEFWHTGTPKSQDENPSGSKAANTIRGAAQAISEMRFAVVKDKNICCLKAEKNKKLKTIA